MLVGRKEEQKTLLKLLDKEESQFCVVYGRRRVGKTYLIRETFHYQFCFQHTGIAGGNYREQLRAFRDSLRIAGMPNATIPQNWFDAFDQLGNLISKSKEGKKVIFIDEFPWMDTQRSKLVSALEHFWNGWVTARPQKDVILILCGSATSWITKNLLLSKGGLRGRITQKIKLTPFSLGECEMYVNNLGLTLQRQDILSLYMILGGIPYYWSFLDKGLSAAQNVDKLFFQETSPLHDEFEALYHTLFRKPENYILIIQALATKKAGMNRQEILDATKLEDNGNFTTILNDLEQCDFIRRYRSIERKERGAIFQLIDNYTLFYYHCLRNNAFDDEQYWQHTSLSPSHNTWQGLAFERVCLQHVRQIKIKLGISGIISNVCGWQTPKTTEHAGTQIDMLIVRGDHAINICEMKYSNDKFTITKKYADDLQRKISIFRQTTGTRDALFLTMVTTYGVAHNEYWNIVQNEVTMDDLFVV